MCRFSTSRPHGCIGPRSATKPSAATTAWARPDDGLAVDGDLDVLEGPLAAQLGDLGLGDDVDVGGQHVLDGALVGAERVAPVHQGDRAGDALEVQCPVERTVAAADDDHVLAGVRLEARDEELHAAADPVLTGRQRARAELADACGDEDGARRAPRCRRRGRRSRRRRRARRVSAVRSRRYSGFAVAACSTRPSTRVRPLTVGKPATSRIAFSGYIAVIWPPSSGSESTTATRCPRKPA